MKGCYLVYSLLLLLISLPGCKSKKEEERYTWSTDAPLSIPYKTRIQRYEKNNLVRNPSFETGRIFHLDSLNSSFAIDGWQIAGEHIQWTDIQKDSVFDTKDAYSGYRAVKIVRTRSFETDKKGEGILSDFIKVIPGNYELSMFLKLKDIKPQQRRLGKRIFDGVDIRLLYFDRNKTALQADKSFPQARQNIDISFKSLSFANYSSIDQFGWSKIIAKSHYFPFPEGDIPTDAHFVKIYVGLKGSGTLWLDSVDFHYTDKNFSVAEKMQKYTDTAFVCRDAIIPVPKEIEKLESVKLFERDDKSVKLPVIVMPRGNNELYRVAEFLQNSLLEHLRSYDNIPASNFKISIVNSDDVNKTTGANWIVSVGETDLYKEYRDKLPVEELNRSSQAYFIYTLHNLPNVIFINSGSLEGLQYAAQTFTQMIDCKAPVFHNARIIDYPDYPMRFISITPPREQVYNGILSENIRELMKYKINGAVVLTLANNEKLNYNHPEFNFTVLPGFRLPEDSTLRFNYPLDLKYSMNKSGSGSPMSLLLAPVFTNEMLDNADHVPCNDPAPGMVYSGCTFFSVNTDAADIKRFSDEIGPIPVFMDNSMLMATPWAQYNGNNPYRPGKMRLFNLFEPFLNTSISEFRNQLDSEMYIVNLPVNSEIEIIRLATAADFLWNSSAYSKELSLWKILLSRYGLENARNLILYADNYSRILEIISKLELNMQYARNVKAGQQIMAELTSIVGKIREDCKYSSRLVKELRILNTQLRDYLKRYSALMPVKK